MIIICLLLSALESYHKASWIAIYKYICLKLPAIYKKNNNFELPVHAEHKILPQKPGTFEQAIEKHIGEVFFNLTFEFKDL